MRTNIAMENHCMEIDDLEKILNFVPYEPMNVHVSLCPFEGLNRFDLESQIEKIAGKQASCNIEKISAKIERATKEDVLRIYRNWFEEVEKGPDSSHSVKALRVEEINWLWGDIQLYIKPYEMLIKIDCILSVPDYVTKIRENIPGGVELRYKSPHL